MRRCGGVAVIDFGLAKVLRPTKAMGDAGSTEFGRLLGGPESMRPEQASGEAVAMHTDVLSLGVLAAGGGCFTDLSELWLWPLAPLGSGKWLWVSDLRGPGIILG